MRSRSQRLLAACEPDLRAALDMRFVRDVAAGVIDDQAYANYLQIEESFVWTAARLHGLAVWEAPSWTAVADNACVIHALVGEQVDYFRAARAAWPVPARMSEEQAKRSGRLSAYVLSAARAGGYAAVMTVMLAAETLYATWCSRAHAHGRIPAGAVADWVALHAGDAFHRGVATLAAAVDQLPDHVSDDRLRQWFTGMLDAEITFHDSVFEELP